MAVRQLIITNPVDNLINGIPENTHSWGGEVSMYCTPFWDISYWQLNDAWFYKWGKCRFFVLLNKWFFEANLPYGQSGSHIRILNWQMLLCQVVRSTINFYFKLVPCLYYFISLFCFLWLHSVKIQLEPFVRAMIHYFCSKLWVKSDRNSWEWLFKTNLKCHFQKNSDFLKLLCFDFENGPTLASLCLFSPFSNTIFQKNCLLASAGFELGSLENKASTLTTWPPPRPSR